MLEGSPDPHRKCPWYLPAPLGKANTPDNKGAAITCQHEATAKNAARPDRLLKSRSLSRVHDHSIDRLLR